MSDHKRNPLFSQKELWAVDPGSQSVVKILARLKDRLNKITLPSFTSLAAEDHEHTTRRLAFDKKNNNKFAEASTTLASDKKMRERN